LECQTEEAEIPTEKCVSNGEFTVDAKHIQPTGLQNTNQEKLKIQPKNVFWTEN